MSILEAIKQGVLVTDLECIPVERRVMLVLRSSVLKIKSIPSDSEYWEFQYIEFEGDC